MNCRMDFNGIKQTGLSAFVPNIGVLPNGIAIVSMGDIMGFSIFADETGIAHPDEFLEMYKSILDKSLDQIIQKE